MFFVCLVVFFFFFFFLGGGGGGGGGGANTSCIPVFIIWGCMQCSQLTLASGLLVTFIIFCHLYLLAIVHREFNIAPVVFFIPFQSLLFPFYICMCLSCNISKMHIVTAQQRKILILDGLDGFVLFNDTWSQKGHSVA